MEAGREIFVESPTGRWVIAATTARMFGSYCVAFYKPLYFAKVYPNFVDEFSIGNAFIYVGIATFSALIGGYLSDKYEDKSYRFKSYLCMISGFFACPAIVACAVYQNDFWFSLEMSALHYIFAELLIAPSITMIQNTTSVKNQGFSAGVYTVFQTIGGLIGTTALGYVQKTMITPLNGDDVSLYGTTFAAFVAFGYLLSVPLYWKAGIEYEK